MSRLAKELGFAARTLRKSPGFAITAIVTLALGIGASTAIFSVVNAVLLRPLPYKDPERLAIIWDDLRNRNVMNFPFSGGDFADLRLEGTLFEGFAGVSTGRMAITDEISKPEMARFAAATTNIFSLLGVRIALGRDFIESDGMPQPPAAPAQNAAQPGTAQQPAQAQAQPQAPRLPVIAILSHGFWKRRYGGDSSVIGKTINLGQQSAQIVGVLQPSVELHFPPKANLERVPDLWFAMRANFEAASRIDHGIRVIGRLKPNTTLAAAQAQMDRLTADLQQRFPIKKTSGMSIRVEPMKLDVVRTVQRPLILLLGAVGFVLLIACANVANLLLVRASARERELAVRSALGGSRWALVRQMLAESLVLAGIGAVIGLLLAQAGIDLLAAIAPSNLPRLDGVRIDLVVLLFSILLTVTSAVIFGLVPALRASRPNIADILRGGGRAASQFGGNALRNAVVMTEVALSFVLLVGSGLMLRSFVAVARTDPGFDPNGVLTFQLQNTRTRGRAEGDAFVRQLRDKLGAIPGVTGLTSASTLPLDGFDPNGRWVVERLAGDEKAFRQAEFFFVHPGYFETMGTRIIAGRSLADADVTAPPQLPPGATPAQAQAALAEFSRAARPIVVDELLAQKAYPGESAVGKRILARLGPEMSPFEIVGVVRHQRHSSLVGEEREIIYFPDFRMNGKWVVRTSGNVNNLLPQVRAAINELNPMLPLAEVMPMSDYVDRAMAPTRFALVMLAIFAAIAAVLASVGLYGVLASAVHQRTAEIGIRMAFGAPSRSIFRLVIGQGLRLSAIGVVIGLVGALALTGVLKTLLVDVTATDPLTFTTIAALFILVATLACWVPARRAAALDPNVALREE